MDNDALVSNVNTLGHEANQLTCANVNLQATVDSLVAENKFLTERLQNVYHDYETFLDYGIGHTEAAIKSFTDFLGNL